MISQVFKPLPHSLVFFILCLLFIVGCGEKTNSDANNQTSNFFEEKNAQHNGDYLATFLKKFNKRKWHKSGTNSVQSIALLNAYQNEIKPKYMLDDFCFVPTELKTTVITACF